MKKSKRPSSRKASIIKGVAYCTASLGLFCAGTAFASSGGSMDAASLADNVIQNTNEVVKMLVVLSYAFGFGFMTAGLAKFKQHKDNPTQIPISAPIALTFVGVTLIASPAIVKTIYQTLFDSSASSGTGAACLQGGNCSLPGSQ